LLSRLFLVSRQPKGHFPADFIAQDFLKVAEAGAELRE